MITERRAGRPVALGQDTPNVGPRTSSGVNAHWNAAGTSRFTLVEVGHDERCTAASPRRGGGAASVATTTMVRYIIRRLLWAIVLLLLVSSLTFLIFYVLPSADPARAARRAASRQPGADRSRSATQLGLDKPWYDAVLDVHQAAGPPLRLRLQLHRTTPSVREQIFDRLPATISLSLGAAVVWLLVGDPDRHHLGGPARHAARPRRDGRRAGRDLGAGLLARARRALPVLRRHRRSSRSSRAPAPTCRSRRTRAKWFGSLILPWLVLAATFAAFYARLLRGNLIEVMSEDYIRTARAKGLRERRGRSAPRRALARSRRSSPSLGLDIGVLLGGAILTETVFNIPGIGRLAYDAIQHADLPMIQGTVLFGAFFIIIANLVVDIVYAFLDPRVRYR